MRAARASHRWRPLRRAPAPAGSGPASAAACVPLCAPLCALACAFVLVKVLGDVIVGVPAPGMLIGPAQAQRSTGKPRVPPGVDPGGVAVAVIGSGVDYTLPAIAGRLARDGEGQLVGWDFLDNDRQPYRACSGAAAGCASPAAALAVAMAERSVPLRLIVIRASAAVPQSLVQAVQLAAQLPVRVVLLTGEGAPMPRRFLREAAQRMPALLLIADLAATERQGPPPQLAPEIASEAASEIGSEIAPEIARNLRIVPSAHEHAAEAALEAARRPELDAAALNALLPMAPAGAAQPARRTGAP